MHEGHPADHSSKQPRWYTERQPQSDRTAANGIIQIAHPSSSTTQGSGTSLNIRIESRENWCLHKRHENPRRFTDKASLLVLKRCSHGNTTSA